MGIRVLEPETAARIAAGEVIIRPASALKELLENSLDAGASSIEVHLEHGGKKLIRVADDGEGIPSNEVELAVQRFATSKISTSDDLERISSYGFRGEALASMAEVADVTIQTQVKGEETGILLRAKGGRVVEKKEIVRTPGTTVEVRELFYNLPARRNFLKSEAYERRRALGVVRDYALSQPGVRFEVEAEGRKVLTYAPADSWEARLEEVYPELKEVELIEVKAAGKILSVEGFVLRPDQAARLKRMQRTFFNSRPVIYRKVYRAIMEGFGPQPGGKPPFFILKLRAPAGMLDANIHPAKTEVQYTDERFLVDFISQAVQRALHLQAVEGFSTADELTQKAYPASTPSYQPEEDTPKLPFTEPSSPRQGMVSVSSSPSPPSSQTGFWQLHNAYILAQVATGLIIVDQHAAHERILYEQMLERLSTQVRQPLLFPLIVELTPEEFAVFEEIAADLKKLGFEAKPFGENQVIVETFPADARMNTADLRELFTEFARTDEVKLGNRDRMAALIACKAAVKEGKPLSQEEMESLINRLFACKTPFFCPHGRPTVIKFSMEDFDKRFGRI